MPTTSARQQRLEQALEVYRQALEGLEGALLEFEAALLEFEEGAFSGRAPESPNSQNLRLLSLPEICRKLEEDRSAVLRRLRSGEIPSLRLGQAVRVRQADLEGYINGRHRHRSLGEENGFAQR